MPTKSPRLNITIDESQVRLLALLAKKRHQSVASLARELILESLERQEDMALSAISDERLSEVEKKKIKTISHKNAWK